MENGWTFAQNSFDSNHNSLKLWYSSLKLWYSLAVFFLFHNWRNDARTGKKFGLLTAWTISWPLTSVIWEIMVELLPTVLWFQSNHNSPEFWYSPVVLLPMFYLDKDARTVNKFSLLTARSAFTASVVGRWMVEELLGVVCFGSQRTWKKVCN